jgi:hypothetical protein
MVMRYAHPQEKHQADAMKRLEVFNAAKEIAEVERQKNRQNEPVSETVPTISPTAAENQGKSAEVISTINSVD